MKKLNFLKTAIFLLMALPIVSFAQNQTETSVEKTAERSVLFPKQNSVGVSILVDGLINNLKLSGKSNDYGQNLLFARYYYKEDLVFRLGFGLKINHFNRERADSVGTSLLERDSTYNKYFINISGGIEKHLLGGKRLDPYLFGQIDLTFVGKTDIETNANTTNSAGTDKVQRTIKEDGGIAFGLVGGAGFNYFIAPRFSLGTELALKVLVSSVGGTITDNQISTPVNGSSTSNFVTRDDIVTQTKIDVDPNLVINLSYFF